MIDDGCAELMRKAEIMRKPRCEGKCEKMNFQE